MIYIIKRFSQILQEKIFGVSNSPENIIKDVYMEGIKLIEMWNTYSKDSPHWINHMSEKMYLIGKNNGDKFQSFFCPIDFHRRKDTPSKILEFSDKYSKGRTPEEIIKDEVNFVCNMTRSGKKKYANQIKIQGGISRSPSDYIYFFKYIALSLSGQYSGGPWDNVRFIEKTEVNYKNQGLKFNNHKDLQKFLSSLFIEFLGPNGYISC